MPKQSKNGRPQTEGFREIARALGCDEDKEKFEETLRKVAAHKPERSRGKKKADKQ